MNATTKTEKFSRGYYSSRNYKDYLTRKFSALVTEIVEATSTCHRDSILDFGCGYGGVVNALWQKGFKNIIGTDVSQWAIEHGHHRFPHLEKRLQFYNRDSLRDGNKLLLMLDVLEHMPEYEVESVLKLARMGAKRSVVVRIPVCMKEGEPFVLPVSNNDPTHICCHTKQWWNSQFERFGFQLKTNLQGAAIYNSPGVLATIYE